MKSKNHIDRYFFLLFILFLFNLTAYSQNTILPNSILSISGYKPGKIPFTALKESKQIDVKSPYLFVSAQVLFGDTTGTKCVGSRLLNRNIFDDAILGAVQNLDKKSLLVFSNLKVIDKNGKMWDVEDAFFSIKN